MKSTCQHKWVWKKHSTYHCPKAKGGCGTTIYGDEVSQLLRALERLRASVKYHHLERELRCR